MSDGLDPRLRESSGVPKRRITPADTSLIVGVALLFTVGLFVGGLGHIAGLLFATIAALGVVTVRAGRFGRVNEPVVEKFTGPVAVGVSSVVVVVTFSLWRVSPVGYPAITLSWAAVVAVYVSFLLLLFRPRGGRSCKQ